MNPSQSSSEAALHAVDYWQVIKNRYGVILLTFMLVFMTVLVVTYVMPKKYESTAVLQVKHQGTGQDILSISNNRPIESLTREWLPTEFEIIKQQKTLDMAIARLNLTDRWNMDVDQVRRTLKKIVDAQNLRGTSLIQIRVRYNDRNDAKLIAEAVADAYRKRRTELQSAQNEKALKELREAVEKQTYEVEEKRKALASIVSRNRIIYPGSNTGPYSQGGVTPGDKAGIAARALEDLKQKMLLLKAQIDTLLNYEGDDLMARAAGLDLPDNIVRTLYPQWTEAKRNFEELKEQGLGEKHPSMMSQSERIRGMKADLDKGVLDLRATLQTQLDTSEEQLKRMEENAEELENVAIEDGLGRHIYDDAKSELENARRLLEQFSLQEVAAKVNGGVTEEPIVIHEEPVVSNVAVSPNVPLHLALGAVVGLIFGVGVAFFLEYLDTSVKSLEDVERYLQVPVLAVIPKDVGVLYKQSGMSPDAEAYRILRTNIEFNRKNPEDNAITVVSGGAGEGKSTTLVNLAYICAQGGYTTLMIDADLRRPRLHTFFDINNSVGLTNYLTTELMLEDVILQTPVDNLYFMPSGILPADAAGILNSRRMSELIQDVKQRFDLVLVDSPPILGVSDASVLASEVDLTMIVVQHRKLPRNMLMRVKQAVENVGGHVIGVVLNNVDVRSDSQYQYYTSYYTYYAPAESQAAIPGGAASSPASKPVQSGGSVKGDQDLY